MVKAEQSPQGQIDHHRKNAKAKVGGQTLPHVADLQLDSKREVH